MLLSRVAETVYWIGRYVERAENTARLVMVNAHLVLDLPKGVALGWAPVLKITGSADTFYQRYGEPSERNVVHFLLSDEGNPGSIISSLVLAREDLRTTRVILPREAWESINDLYLHAKDNLSTGVSRRGRYAFLEGIIEHCQRFTGLLCGTMSHDEAYTFMRMGRNLERADMTARVTDVRAGNLLPERDEALKPYDDIQWMSVLNSLAAYQMYRRHVHLRVRGRDVLRFLFQDMEFPRSVLHCLGEVGSCVRRFARHELALRSLGRAQRMMQDVEISALKGEHLNRFVDRFQVALAEVHEQISLTYFLEQRSATARSPTTARSPATARSPQGVARIAAAAGP